MLPDSIITQSTIPISTVAPTHYVSFSTHIFLYIFQIFPKFLGPFPSPGGFCPPFSNSPSHAPYPHILFPNFRPFFTLPSSVYPPPDDRHAPSTNKGGQPKARRPYMANILYYTLNFTSTYPLHHEAVEPNLHRHPYVVQSLGLLPTIFRIPLLTLHNLPFFPTFRPQFSLPSSR